MKGDLEILDEFSLDVLIKNCAFRLMLKVNAYFILNLVNFTLYNMASKFLKPGARYLLTAKFIRATCLTQKPSVCAQLLNFW